jgi:molybdopterin synthase catalytic subunit
VEADIPGSRVAVQHRLGMLEIGDVAVMIAAASAHRAEAFDACRLVIDRLKQDVPIWKREYGPDGEEWVSDRP